MGRGRRVERERYWRKVIGDQVGSGLSISAFCRERGVSPASFFSWRRKLAAGGREEATGKFVPIELVPPESPPGRPGFELTLPNGLRVHVPPQFDADALRVLLDVLEARAC